MEANRELLERYVELYNAGELDACMELSAEDAVQWRHDGLFPDARYVVESFVEEGDRFADEWTFTGTNTGPLQLPDGTEIPGTGKPVRIKGMELVEVRDGKIVVDNLYYDFMAAVAQLGLVPEGATA